MTEITDHFARFAELKKRSRPAETELDRFAAYVASGAIIFKASAFDVCADGGDSERTYKPEGGLTEAVYRLAGDDLAKSTLAQGILAGELVRGGHDYRTVCDHLKTYDADELRDLVEANSFRAVADALAQEIFASADRAKRETRGRSVPEGGLKIGDETGTTPAQEGTVAALLRRLQALEEAVVRPPALTTTWEAMARSINRIADALDPPQPAIVGSVYVARRLGCTTTWIADQARNGDIPQRCIVVGTGRGKPWKFYREQIDDWIDSR